MSLIRLKDNLKRPVAMAATGLFLFSAALFFSPVNLAHKITIPVGILAVSALWLCPWQIALALAFSAAGDYFGSVGNLMAQMGCFAIAHIWYIKGISPKMGLVLDIPAKQVEEVIYFMSQVVLDAGTCKHLSKGDVLDEKTARERFSVIIGEILEKLGYSKERISHV